MCDKHDLTPSSGNVIPNSNISNEEFDSDTHDIRIWRGIWVDDGIISCMIGKMGVKLGAVHK